MSEYAQQLTSLLSERIRSAGLGGLTTAQDVRIFETLVIEAVASLEARSRGSRIFAQQMDGGLPDPSGGMEGDLFIVIDTGDLFVYVDGVWGLLFNLMPRTNAFAPVQQNAYGTHPAFNTERDWLIWLTQHLGTGGGTTPAPAPTITGFLPMSGARGSTVVLTGTGFTGATVVSINSGAVASHVVNSATQITAVLSNTQTTGKVRVTVPGAGTAVSAADFTVTVAPAGPTITSFTPTSGAVGSSITLTGTNLSGATAAKVNGTAGTITANTATSLTFTVGAGSTTGTVTVTTAAGTATSSGAFTVTSVQLSGVNIVVHGNSLTYGLAGGPASAPAQMAGRFVGEVDYYYTDGITVPSNLAATRDYRVINSGVGGRTLQQMLDNFNTQVLPYYDPTALFNLYYPQEQINELSRGTTGTQYLVILRALCQLAKDTGFIVRPITGTPVTQLPGAGLDFNITSQGISAAIRNPTSSDTWTRCIDLARNSHVGVYGTAPDGQDNGYASFSTDNFYDGTHPTPFVDRIIGQMEYDEVEYTVHGTPLPDASDYPTVPMVGPLITWVNPSNVGTGTIDNSTGTVSTTSTTPYAFGPRSQQVLTAGVGLRGKIQYTLQGGVGGFGGSNQDAGSADFGQVACALFTDNNGVLKLATNNAFSGNIGSWSSSDVFEEWVYADRIDWHKNGSATPFVTDNRAPSFPFFAKVLIDGGVFGSRLSNCNMLVLP